MYTFISKYIADSVIHFHNQIPTHIYVYMIYEFSKNSRIQSELIYLRIPSSKKSFSL